MKREYKILNVEYRISNVEVKPPIIGFILLHSAFNIQYSTFFSSLFHFSVFNF